MSDKETTQKLKERGNRITKELSDKEIIQKLIERDNQVTHDFLHKDCKRLFQSIIGKLFSYEVDYDEFVNELYVHLMEDDARRLRSFNFKCSVFGWIKTVALFYFMDKKNHDKVIEDVTKDPLVEKKEDSITPLAVIEAKIDIEELLKRLEATHPRYAYVLRKLYIENMLPEELAKEMDITVANLYNIKKRALHQLALLIINDKKRTEK